MISSVSDLVARVGVGGRLVAFFKAVCVYFAVAPAPPSAAAAAAKVAPVLCLLLLVVLPQPERSPAQWRYARRVAGGLALSALGDALLVWPGAFVAGMAAFAAAHLCYVAAFGWRPRAPAIAAACYGAAAWFVSTLRPQGLLRALVPLYALLLATCAWRALAAGARPAAPRAARAAAAGALLFLLSDAILGYTMFAADLPYKQVAIMSTYYLAQLGIALSALEPPVEQPVESPAQPLAR